MTQSKRRWLRTVWGWELAASLLISVVFLWFVLPSDRPLEDAAGALYASVPYGIALAVAGLVASRWMTDRLKDDAYGELLRSVDPDESRSQDPFIVVVISGLIATLIGIVLILIQGELGRTPTALSWALLLFFALYGLFGTADLVRIVRRHLRRQARLRSTQERERRRREG